MRGEHMGATAFYERRKQTSSTTERDRRNGYRRRKQTAVPSNKRRIAAHARSHERLKFHIPIRLKLRDKEVQGHTGNISQDGLHFVCDAVVEVGTPLTLQFSFGENFCYMNISGQVVYCFPVKGKKTGHYEIGVKLSALRDQEKIILTSVVQELRQNPIMCQQSILSVSVSADTLAQEAGR